MEKKQVMQVIHVGRILSFYIRVYIFIWKRMNGNCVATHTMDLQLLFWFWWIGRESGAAVRESDLIIYYAA